jgi:hypothetical protein
MHRTSGLASYNTAYCVRPDSGRHTLLGLEVRCTLRPRKQFTDPGKLCVSHLHNLACVLHRRIWRAWSGKLCSLSVANLLEFLPVELLCALKVGRSVKVLSEETNEVAVSKMMRTVA